MQNFVRVNVSVGLFIQKIYNTSFHLQKSSKEWVEPNFDSHNYTKEFTTLGLLEHSMYHFAGIEPNPQTIYGKIKVVTF